MSFRVDVSPYSMVDRSTTNKDLQHPKTRSFNKFTRSELGNKKKCLLLLFEVSNRFNPIATNWTRQPRPCTVVWRSYPRSILVGAGFEHFVDGHGKIHAGIRGQHPSLPIEQIQAGETGNVERFENLRPRPNDRKPAPIFPADLQAA